MTLAEGRETLSRRSVLKLGAAGLGLAVTACDSDPSRPEEPRVSGPSFRVAERFRPFELIAPGFELVDQAAGPSAGMTRTQQSPVAPFAAVELEVTRISTTGVLAGLATADDEHVAVAYDSSRSRMSIEVRVDGRTRVVRTKRIKLQSPFRLGFVLCENQVTGLADSGDGWVPVLTMRDRVAALLDLREPATLARYTFAYGPRSAGDGLELGSVRAGAFGYAGLRDPHLVQHPDGTPVVRDGLAYLTFTCAGMGFFQQAHWGVFTLDLADPTDLRQVSQLYFSRDGLVLGDHAGQLIVDEDTGQSFLGVSSWGDFDYSGVHVRHASSTEDLLSGVHVLETEQLELPTSVGTWDPSFTRIDERWHVAFVESPSQDPFDFHPALAIGAAGGAYDKGLELVGIDDTVLECEGPIIAQLDGDWRVLASSLDAREYPVYDLKMERVGVLDAPYLTNIPHPQIVDLPDAGHLMVTFDGTAYGMRVLGYGTHGDVVVMRAS